MDYYKNIDHFPCADSGSLRAVGVQYDEVVPLSNDVITLEEFKAHARIDFHSDDNLCQLYIDAAVYELQDWAQLSFGVRTMRLRAKSLPDGYRIMYGRVDTITGTDYTNTGDILDKGGRNIDIEYTTIGKLNEAIKVAVARYAAGLYIFRENITETKYSSQGLKDEAKEMLKPYRNLII